MSNYYSKRNAKVRIAEELFARGWKVYGYKEDQSDSMTDYYSPANWGGIAEKNGYILVVDNKCASEGADITRYNPNYISMSAADNNKIQSLKNMTVEKGATAGEETNAKNLIEKIQSKYSNEGVAQYEVIGRIPAHMANSKGSIWHIEKDGALVDKGNKLTIFADCPESYVFDINTMEYKDSYKTTYNWIWNEDAGRNIQEAVERTLSDEERKAINELKTFILRIERAVNGLNSCGDGTAETEKAGMEQQNNETMEKVIVEKKKNVVKMVEIHRDEELKINDVVFVSGSGYCKVYEVKAELNLYRVVKLGSASRGYKESKVMSGHVSLNKKSFDGSLNRGYLKVYNLVTVEEIEKVEKWVKVKAEKKQEVKEPEAVKEVKEEKENNLLTIEELKDGDCIAVLKNKNTGDVKEVNGSYSEKFQVVYLIWQDPWEIIGYKQTIENVEIIEEVKENIKAEEVAAEQEENKINVSVKFNEEKNGIELYFTGKPSDKVREGLKAKGFRWSKFNGCWYIKDSEQARQYLNQIGFTGAEQGEEIPLDSTPVEAIEAPVIEFDSIEQYTISEALSKRENECHWVFRSKERNHTQEMQDHFTSCKEELLKVLENTGNTIIKNSGIRFFNSYMKKYNDLFTKMLRNRADMPSVAVAGAGNYNYNRMNRNNDRYGNLLGEYTALTDGFKAKISSIKHDIKKEKDKKTADKINAHKDSYSDLKLTKTTIKYNPSAVDNIFTGATSETSGYIYNDYYIIKNWGSFRIYDKQGNTMYIDNLPCSTATLKDAKLFLSYIVENQLKEAV